MTTLARLLIRVFFRTVDVEGIDLLPASGPVVLVANHTNGLVDGLLLMASLGRDPRFLGKSTLFRITPLWPFLKLAGVIPVHRAIDAAGAGDGSTNSNISAFATSRDVLARGGMVAVFPEGISHDELRLQPLKTGAARIALEASFDDDIPGVVVVAVGLTYDAKARFRSRALVRVGRPAGVARLAESYRHDPQVTAHCLTDELGRRLSSVSPTYSSWAEAEKYARMAEIVVREPGARLPTGIEMAEQEAVATRLSEVWNNGADSDDDAQRQQLAAAFAAYERDLGLLGLDDAQVTAGYPRDRLRLAVVWSVMKVAVALPFAAIGVAVHIIPFEVVKQLAKKPTNEGIKATVKLLGCFAGFILVYAAIGVLVGEAYGGWAGFLAAVAAPCCGYAAVRVHERLRRVGGLLEGYRTVRERRDTIGSVLEHRAAATATAYAVMVGS